MKKLIKILIFTLMIIVLIMPLYNGSENNIYPQKSLNRYDPEAPNPPIISGPSQGKLHYRYSYEITSEDPQCDNICYTIRSSDLPVIYMSKFCESGTTIIYNHSWDDFYQKEPPYMLNAKATDCLGHESEWSTFEVSIPRNKIIINTIFEKILTIISLLKY